MDSFQDAARGADEDRGSGAPGRLMALWIAACAVIIVLGLNRMHPQYGERLAYAFRDPAMDLTQPFATCKAANAAGYFDIPRESSAYLRWQDPAHPPLGRAPPHGRPPGP